jgi:hypothetical protein
LVLVFSEAVSDSETLLGLMFFGGGGFIGAGLLAPFNRPWFGGMFGVAVMGIVLYLYLLGLLPL